MSELAKLGWMLVGGGCVTLVLVVAGFMWVITRKWYI